MSKKLKVCKKCKIVVEGEKCQRCGGTDFTDSWKGRIIVLNANESELAKEMKIDQNGEYAIKIK